MIAKCFNGYDISTLPVQVVTQDSERNWNVCEFCNLAEAQKQFPTLDPATNTNDFTWAMHGEVNGEIALRFENWQANNTLSTILSDLLTAMHLITDEDHYGAEEWEHYKALALRQRQMLVKRRPPVSNRLAGVAVLCVLLALCYVAGVLLHAVHP